MPFVFGAPSSNFPAIAPAAMAAASACGAPASASRKGAFPLRRTEGEWRKLLTPAQYAELVQHIEGFNYAEAHRMLQATMAPPCARPAAS